MRWMKSRTSCCESSLPFDIRRCSTPMLAYAVDDESDGGGGIPASRAQPATDNAIPHSSTTTRDRVRMATPSVCLPRTLKHHGLRLKGPVFRPSCCPRGRSASPSGVVHTALSSAICRARRRPCNTTRWRNCSDRPWAKGSTMRSRYMARACAAWAALLLGTSMAVAAPAVPAVTGNARVDALLSEMTLAEKLSLIHGTQEDPKTYQGQAGYVSGIPRLGIPGLRFADGPPGALTRQPAQALTATMGVAATFSRKLAEANGT